MKIITTIFTLLIAVAITAFASPLEGSWEAVDPETRGFPKLKILKGNSGYEFELWSVTKVKLERSLRMDLELLGDSVDDPNPTKHGFALKDLDWATKRYILIREGDELVLEQLTIFKPISQRNVKMRDDRVNTRSLTRYRLEEGLE